MDIIFTLTERRRFPGTSDYVDGAATTETLSLGLCQVSDKPEDWNREHRADRISHIRELAERWTAKDDGNPINKRTASITLDRRQGCGEPYSFIIEIDEEEPEEFWRAAGRRAEYVLEHMEAALDLVHAAEAERKRLAEALYDALNGRFA